jgi:hypothetical protein
VDRRVGLAELFTGRAAAGFFFVFAVFVAVLPRAADFRALAALLRVDARGRFWEGARFRAWLEPFREDLPALRRAVFFAMAL